MKENSQRRDPKGEANAEHSPAADEKLERERNAEAATDQNVRTDASRLHGDEQTNVGRREAQIAGGNGEQASRERARVKSERDEQGEQRSETAKERLPIERTSAAPMSQGGARVSDFEGSGT